MAAGVRETVIQIVNKVQDKLGVNTTTDLTTTKHSGVLLQLLNEVIADLNDSGNWQELYTEIEVTAESSVNQYVISPRQFVTQASGIAGFPKFDSALSAKEVHHIHEVSFGSQSSPLELRTIEDIRRLRRTQRDSTGGNPRQWSVIGTNVSGHPVMEVFPKPSSQFNNQRFNIALYVKEPLLSESDVSAVPVFPSNVLVQGLYAKALLEQDDGAPTPTSNAEFAIYERLKREALNRFTVDSGTDVYLYPGRFSGGGPWRSR